MFKGRILDNSSGTTYGFAKLEKKTGRDPDKPERTRQSGSDIDLIQKEAYEKGYRAGEDAGLAMGREKADVILDGVEKILEDLSGVREEILRNMEPKIFELSQAVARRILTTELSSNPEGVVLMIKNALEKIQRMGQITVRLNPAIYDVIASNRKELIDLYPDIQFTVDPAVPVHGPVITSLREEVLLDIDAQIANILDDIVEQND